MEIQDRDIILRLRGDKGQYRVTVNTAETFHRLIEKVDFAKRRICEKVPKEAVSSAYNRTASLYGTFGGF